MAETARVDLLDRRLLAALDRNARSSVSALARAVGEGRDRVEYRYRRLVELGVVRGTSAVINPYRLGLTVYKTYLKLENRRTRIVEFLRFLQAHPRVYWIAECDGRWDFIFSVFATSPFEFYRVQNEVLSNFGDLVLSFDVFTLVNLWLYRRSYLGAASDEGVLIGGMPEFNRLGDLEYQLLKALAEDARSATTHLAELLSTTPTIISNRIGKLEQGGIIGGYRVDLDLAKLGMTMFKAQLYLRQYRDEDVQKLRSFCAHHPRITYFIEQLGDCKLEVELEVASYDEYVSIIRELRSRHCGLIRNIETNLIAHEEYHWSPRGIRLYAENHAT
ncbi:MAG: Lrp/AsnC family transcriptional regulator [Bdellovibrionales bacterium]|nr:Lrp/AsnC family transcriptional regulator [Bdellovibrionales bacterium]